MHRKSYYLNLVLIKLKLSELSSLVVIAWNCEFISKFIK